MKYLKLYENYQEEDDYWDIIGGNPMMKMNYEQIRKYWKSFKEKVLKMIDDNEDVYKVAAYVKKNIKRFAYDTVKSTEMNDFIGHIIKKYGTGKDLDKEKLKMMMNELPDETTDMEKYYKNSKKDLIDKKTELLRPEFLKFIEKIRNSIPEDRIEIFQTGLLKFGNGKYIRDEDLIEVLKLIKCNEMNILTYNEFLNESILTSVKSTLQKLKNYFKTKSKIFTKIEDNIEQLKEDKKMSVEEDLKGLIQRSETRFLYYKKALEDMHKDKEHFLPKDINTTEFKDILRELKNQEDIWLNSLREEQTYLRQGLNPPYTYKRK
jgi:hypothetical protein